jgi:hypothetical protein
MYATTVNTTTTKTITHRFDVGDEIVGHWESISHTEGPSWYTIEAVGLYPDALPDGVGTAYPDRHGEPMYRLGGRDWEFVVDVDDRGSFMLAPPPLKFKVGDELISKCGSARRTITRADADSDVPYSLAREDGSSIDRLTREYVESTYNLAVRPPKPQVKDLTRDQLEKIVRDLAASMQEGWLLYEPLSYSAPRPPKWASLDPIKHLWEKK